MKATPWDEYYIKLISAAKTRGKTGEAMEGDYMTKMPWYVTAADGSTKRDPHDANQLKMKEENDRARVDLIMAMPGCRLTKIVNDGTSPDFPEGCVHTALQKLKIRLYKVTSGNRRQLKAAFEPDTKFPKNGNPAKYIDKLIDLQKKLKDKYQYDKKDDDIVD